MSKYTEDSKRLLEYIGGKENIVAVSHCATRMRFVLKDDKKADGKKIKSIKLVKGTFMQAGQFQVIIGNEVPDFYNEFVNVSGVDGVSKDKAKIEAKGNMNFIQRMLANLAEIFTPLIPALIVGGLILGFRNVIGDIKFLENGTKTITQMYPFWAGVYSFLWLIGEAIFNFLPVGITWAISKKMGTTQILGIVLGLTLVSPQLLNAYDVAGAAADKIPFWNFGAFHIQMIGYQAQVIPAIMAGFLLAIFEKNVRKIVPEYISMIVVPFLALVPTVIIAHTVLGPIGWAIGSVISSVVYTGLTSAFGWLFAAVFGFFYAPLVITGLHHMSNAIDLQLMAEFGGTNLWPMIALSNIAQGSAVMAIIRINKKAKPEEEQVSIPAAISCYLGVTEPAIFGINLKYVYPFLAAMVGSAIAGVISVSSGVMANSIGVGGIPGILSIKPKYMLIFSLAMIVAIVVSFTLTLILSKTKFAAKFAPED
ncbi:PTS system trehalose-specific EIIBC component [Clostridium sp. CM028]|uniref:PTS system trehalose-specific EIIBC component n=1 Tax=unclassified Clostridium TaxID=2614128 RepID=UPI001C6F59F7|nr:MULTISPECIES: PTS system trehalose-specific EIIBC component [unclassified Clostridium]MBW9145915.1 PTS system trehalose-specific EIIBC component [Clostridium sp. CM027]MBW9149604.1 PTS system trehalose-specific EIIBC component [Clostridium sp. CM028]UVE40894.1 PTS system trehalose-specific EIIBC component [Clostridium sp. CM027]WLC61562.1 PTS system trehalose-specific EIIBC component [Clostridium sp. CM028]